MSNYLIYLDIGLFLICILDYLYIESPGFRPGTVVLFRACSRRSCVAGTKMLPAQILRWIRYDLCSLFQEVISYSCKQLKGSAPRTRSRLDEHFGILTNGVCEGVTRGDLLPLISTCNGGSYRCLIQRKQFFGVI